MSTINIREEAARCLLCQNPPCSAVCKNGDPARAVRAIKSENIDNAGKWFAGCTEEELKAAEKACIHYDWPVRLRALAKSVPEPYEGPLPSLETQLCGIPCENPFFLASSAVCTNYDMVASAFEAGWAGVFYKTICLQEINEVSPRFDAVKRADGSFAGFRNMEQLSENPVEVDFDILHRLKENYPNKVVVASIMGQTDEQWIELAQMAEHAGVDAIELNFSCPQMRLAGMGSDVGQNSELVSYHTAFVKRSVSIPVIAKMTPNVASMTPSAMAAKFSGADGLSAINTIKSITPGGIVGEKKIVSGYSGAAVKPIALRFILEMADNPIKEKLNISGLGGIYTWSDALDFIKLGCQTVQVCTSIMEYGQRIIDDLILGLQTYMAKNGISKISDMVGADIGNFVSPLTVDRDTMVFPTIDREKCIGCGRCYISCKDGGHQAITFEDDRQPKINGAKCVGCHLCRLVCPTGAMGIAKRIPKRKKQGEVDSA